MLDGIAARKLKQQSEAGARLDSIADVIFAFAIAVVAVIYFTLPVWLWIWTACIALVRIISYSAGFYRYHTFAALHTYANKVTGILIFTFPLLFRVCGITAAGIILCAAASLSSLEELVITLKSGKLNRDCKGWFIQ